MFCIYTAFLRRLPLLNRPPPQEQPVHIVSIHRNNYTQSARGRQPKKSKIFDNFLIPALAAGKPVIYGAFGGAAGI
jgi:hypothetical protein